MMRQSVLPLSSSMLKSIAMAVLPESSDASVPSKIPVHIVVVGVETVKTDTDAGKLTIVGKLDPSKLRDKLAKKTKKKVDLISPQPKKENKDSKADNKKPDDKPEKKKPDAKSKEPPVTTAVLKVALHCQGCIERIRKTVSKTKGVHDMSLDKEKDTVTVKGTMDVKALVETLMERLKRKVEVVPPKKDKDKEGGEGKEGSNGGGKKKKGSGGGNDKAEEGDEKGKILMEQNKMEIVAPAYGSYGYGNGYYYGTVYYMEHLHAPQMFSDENPNACSVM
ncbi:heavy metal-associated isoprenylated plant protein 3 [Senna tora]|uniref:Heavy metal-associated isoprenylated plant protein 3 n=1 Tax=Senna tora TaxID=362788 RepID=A0A834TKA1_9FABA|nr:heavy metal-associated isoprenylated plant protein 3 [Senna tora]